MDGAKVLKESRFNHMGKLAFRWVYWNMLLKGVPIPFVSAKMNEKGKKLENLKVEYSYTFCLEFRK